MKQTDVSPFTFCCITVMPLRFAFSCVFHCFACWTYVIYFIHMSCSWRPTRGCVSSGGSRVATNKLLRIKRRLPRGDQQTTTATNRKRLFNCSHYLFSFQFPPLRLSSPRKFLFLVLLGKQKFLEESNIKIQKILKNPRTSKKPKKP